jgi:hypothetical protein
MNNTQAVPHTQVEFSVGFGVYDAKNLQVVSATNMREIEQLVDRYSMPVSSLIHDSHKVQSREDYDKLPAKIRKQIKLKGNYFIAGVTDNGGRTHPDMRTCGVALVDIDSGNLSAADIELHFGAWNFRAWESISSRVTNRKWKILLPLHEHMTTEQYQLVYPNWLKGLGCFKDCDESQGKAPQPALLPVLWPKSPPIMLSIRSGVALNLLNFLPSGVVPADVLGVQATLAERRFQNYVPPVGGLTGERINEVLAQLENQTESGWMTVARALHHQFVGSDEGFDYWDAWSAQGYGDYSSKTCEYKWGKLHTTPLGSRPTTWQTLENLIANRQTATRRHHWQAEIEANDDLDIIIADVTAGISADNQLKIEDKKILARSLKARATELGDNERLVGDWEAMLKPPALKQRKDDVYVPPTVDLGLDLIPTNDMRPKGLTWKAEWTFLRNQEKFYHLPTREHYSSKTLRAVLNRDLFSVEGKRQAHADDYMNEVLKIEHVFDTEYSPKKPILFEHEGRRMVNEWSTSSLPTGWDFFEESLGSPTYSYRQRLGITRFLRHICALLEPADRKNFIRWLAWCIQNEGRKAQWVPIIHSLHGAGKTLMCNVIRAMFGHKNSTVVTSDVVTSDAGFNPWVAGHTFCVVEELKVFGGKSNGFAVSNKLKDIVTNDVVTVNQKNERSRVVRNTQNYLALTNYIDPISVDSATERRWFMCRSRIRDIEQVNALRGRDGGEYFTKLDTLAHDDELVLGMRRWLYHYNLKGWAPLDKAPETLWWQQLVEISGSGTAHGNIPDLLETDWPGNHPDQGWFSLGHMKDYIVREGIDGEHTPEQVIGKGRTIESKLVSMGYRKMVLGEGGKGFGGAPKHAGAAARIKIDGRPTMIYYKRTVQTEGWFNLLKKNSVDFHQALRSHIRRVIEQQTHTHKTQEMGQEFKNE